MDSMASVDLQETNASGCHPFPDVQEIPLEVLFGYGDDDDRPTGEIAARLIVEDGRPPASATKFNSAV
jgi:hypothetical protein